MLKYMKGYVRCAVCAPFMKLAEALLELYVPLFIGRVIDEGVKNGDSSAVIKNCAVIALFGLAGMLVSVTSQWFSAKAAVGFSSALREDLFSKVLSISRSDTDKAGQAALITRLTADTDRVQNGINMGLRLLLRSPFIVFGSVIMAAVIDPMAGLIFLITVAILAVIIFAVVYGSVPMQGRASKKLEKVTSKVRDNLRGVRVIRAFGREESEKESFDVENSAEAEAVIRAGRLVSLMNPLTFAVINIAIIIVIRYGGMKVSSGIFLSGSVVALYNYMGQILVELVKLANLTLTLSRAISCAKRIEAVLELPDDIPAVQAGTSEQGDSAYVLEFRDVSFRYEGAGADSISHISFALKPGESLGILGGTGSGKSTLANLITALYRPTDGKIFIDGRDSASVKPADIRSKISAVPQYAKLFSGSIADNIRRGREEASDEDVRKALKLAAALDFSEEKEQGLDTEVLSGGSNFSGGQKQRLTIARALVRSCSILVLDDCLSALDYKTDLEVRRNISGLEPRPATVIISQRPSTVLACDRILVLDNGTAAGLGTAAELLESCALYREIYDSQYSGKEAAQ